MDEEKNYSRVNKYDKRRKTTKSITILMAIAVLLVILLIGFWLFGGKKDKENDEEEQSQNTGEVEESDEHSNQSSNDSSASNEEEENEDVTEDDKEDKDESEDEGSLEIEEIPEDEIDNPNVIEAYTANWEPIGTSQEEPHTTQYDQGTDDWDEIQEAIAYALEIEKDEIISHWIGNGGEQRVNGYVQSTVTDDHYTVYLQWKENEGWQPIKVERVERFIHPKQAE